jgi:hypothetical protein
VTLHKQGLFPALKTDRRPLMPHRLALATVVEQTADAIMITDSSGVELVRVLTGQMDGVTGVGRCPGFRVRMVSPHNSSSDNGHGEGNS